MLETLSKILFLNLQKQMKINQGDSSSHHLQITIIAKSKVQILKKD